jgi:PilZ domain
MERRRRAPRVNTTAWIGRYTVEDDPGLLSRECRVIDISILGLGLELFGEVTEDMIGRRLVVQVGAPAGESVSLRLVGEVRNLVAGQYGGTRAGLEFTDLSEAEREILKAMELLKVAW